MNHISTGLQWQFHAARMITLVLSNQWICRKLIPKLLWRAGLMGHTTMCHMCWKNGLDAWIIEVKDEPLDTLGAKFLVQLFQLYSASNTHVFSQKMAICSYFQLTSCYFTSRFGIHGRVWMRWSAVQLRAFWQPADLEHIWLQLHFNENFVHVPSFLYSVAIVFA